MIWFGVTDSNSYDATRIISSHKEVCLIDEIQLKIYLNLKERYTYVNKYILNTNEKG